MEGGCKRDESEKWEESGMDIKGNFSWLPLYSDECTNKRVKREGITCDLWMNRIQVARDVKLSLFKKVYLIFKIKVLSGS